MTHIGFFMRMTGGPQDGNTYVAPPEMGWPLPDVLPHPDGGRYEKESESQLPPEVDDKEGIVRGAQYRWVADE